MRYLILAFLVAWSVVAVPRAAVARDLPLMGGPGGSPHVLRCSGGEHLVGLKVHSGLWIDNIQIQCSKLANSGSAMSHVRLTLGGSAGGAGGTDSPGKVCSQGRAIGSLGVHVFSNKTRMVRDVVFGCVTERGGGGGTLSIGNDTTGNFPPMQSCSRGEGAIGLQVRSGGYVDAIGLICEPLSIGTNDATTPSAITTSTGTTSTSTVGSKLISYANAVVNKCVDRSLHIRNQRCPSLPIGQVGDGECTDFVNGAIVSAGFPKVDGYVWGTKIGDNTTSNKGLFRPGDIIQLFGVSLVGTNGTWATSSQHTAIIEANNGGVLSVIEQNTNLNGENRRYVTRGTLNLTWQLQNGSYIVYRK